MGRKKKEQFERPDDSLPPEELQKAWDNILDSEVGKPGSRPSKEVLVNPLMLEWFAEVVGNYSENTKPLEDSIRKNLYLEVLRESLSEIPLLNRDILQRYFGMEWDTPQTQDEIAANLGISQKNVSIRIKYAKRDLARIMRTKIAERIREENDDDS